MLRVLACGALALATAGPAYGHTVGMSRGEYRIQSADVTAELVFARPELADSLPALDANHDGVIDSSELFAARHAIDEAFVQGLDVRVPSGRCPGVLQETLLTEQDGVAVHALFHCPAEPATVAFELKFLGALSHGHRHLATGFAGSSTLRNVAYQENAGFHIVVPGAVEPSTRVSAAAVWPLFRLGIQHILTGYDHLAFLLGLILVGGRLRSLLVVVTAFTVAHSITLGLATLQIWTPSVAFVEPAIALSITYIGVENWFVKDAARRWMITFPFGLVHGFGFSGALRQIALPHQEIPLALLAFNGGVEAGQMAVLVVVLPAVLWLRGRQWFAAGGVRTISGAIAAAGVWWFLIRVT